MQKKVSSFWPESSYEDRYEECWCCLFLTNDLGGGARVWMIPMVDIMPKNPTRFQTCALEVCESSKALAQWVYRALNLSDWGVDDRVAIEDNPAWHVSCVDVNDSCAIASSSLVIEWVESDEVWSELCDWIESGLKESFPKLSSAIQWSPMEMSKAVDVATSRMLRDIETIKVQRESKELSGAVGGLECSPKAGALRV